MVGIRTRSSTLESRYGATSEDIYGCLYFFLTEQLRKFARRLVSFRMSLNIIVLRRKASTEVAIYWRALSRGPSTRDPIRPHSRLEYYGFKLPRAKGSADEPWAPFSQVSAQYTRRVFTELEPRPERWAPKWCFTKQSTSGYDPFTDKSRVCQRLAASIQRFDLLDLYLQDSHLRIGSKAVVAEAFSMDAELGHENSGAFSQYLNNQGLTQALAESKLKMKTKHTILPRRIGIPVDSPHTALPKFSIDESWYLHTRSSGCDWLERFMEFTPADI
ncbi:hypothetical protein BKA70DRAFT_756707 [Coprinopsis sp. MPI-PUGE-AT-0042]|nr:hypothetical protein BKA70DRAFT_756707 [Coprinopsis sp. MPI-PUGE-AT-0042]